MLPANKCPSMNITYIAMEFYVIVKHIEDTVQVSLIGSRAAQITSASPGYIHPYPAPTTLNL